MRLSSYPRRSAPNYIAIKQKQQATWASGDFAVVGTTLQIVGESLAEAADVCADERVLDVAAGNGNATLAAARRFARVTSTDYVPALLDKGRERARAEGLAVRFHEADVEELPFADATYDVVLSTFGSMFTPDHARTASEMMRVLRPGGRVGMANWTPEGFIGRLFKVIGAHVPPPAGLKSPALWGNEAYVTELFRQPRRRSAASVASSTSATGRPPTSCRCSATTTARRTRPSPRSTQSGKQALDRDITHAAER